MPNGDRRSGGEARTAHASGEDRPLYSRCLAPVIREEYPNVIDLLAADTRVFLFHSANAKDDPGGAMDAVNQWLSKDRSGGPYSNLRVRDITVSSDGAGGVFTTIVCSLGRAAETAGAATAQEPAGTMA